MKNGIYKSLNYVNRVYGIRNNFPAKTVRSLVTGQFIPMLSKLLPNKFIRSVALNKHQLVEKYLMDHYGYLISDYDEKNFDIVENTIPHIIWTFWYQGEENAPDIVKACLNSLRKSIEDTDIKLVVLSKYNFTEYVDIPDYIISKKDLGLISLTEFSDILRSALLAKFGGFWIDATIFSVRPIDMSIFQNPMFTLHFFDGSVWSPAVAHHRWNTYFIGVRKNDKLFSFVRDFLYTYWKNESYLLDYLLIDYAMDLACRHFNDVDKLVNSIPVSNIMCLKLHNKLGNEYSKDEFEKLTRNTDFFKLTYKSKVKNSNTNFYSALFNGKLWLVD